ncbi:thioesterase II family protein [Streptomyces sp. NPDC054841]
MSSTDVWIRHLGPPAVTTGTHTELVCFPHAGGSAGAHRPLAAALAGQAEVIGVQYPGRQDRLAEPVITDLHLLADAIADRLAARGAGQGTERRRVFFGHSMGAIVAYEVARRLGEDGPCALFVSGRPAPSRIRRTTAHQLDDDALLGQVVSLGGSDKELLGHPELRALVLPVVRGDYRASETYRHRGGPPLACPVTVFTGDADPLTPIADARAWAAHTTGPFRLRILEGGHFFVDAHWSAVARTVQHTLESVLA